MFKGKSYSNTAKQTKSKKKIFTPNGKRENLRFGGYISYPWFYFLPNFRHSEKSSCFAFGTNNLSLSYPKLSIYDTTITGFAGIPNKENVFKTNTVC